jgi:hypothetical protein
MPYQPGPFHLQSEVDAAVLPGVYNFQGDLGDLLNGILDAGGSMDTALLGMQLIAFEPSDPFPGFDINGALDAVTTSANASLGTDFETVLLAVADADLGLATAIGYAPIESWTADAAPFVAPVAAEILAIPLIPPGVVDFTITGTVSSGTSGTGGPQPLPGPGVSISNLTQLGNPNFRVGDVIGVHATGPVGQDVRVQSQLDGVDIGGQVVGTIGPGGTFDWSAPLGPGQVGAWTQFWYIGYGNVANYSFVVVD